MGAGGKTLRQPEFSARGLIRRSNVAMIGTTDDPCSDLKYHELLRNSGFETKVCPSFRPDPALNPHKPGFADYIRILSAASGLELQSAANVAAALSQRMTHFDAMGCRAADHGLDYVMFRLLPQSTVMELVHAFETANQMKLPYVMGPRRDGDLPAFWADAEKARMLLGWEAKYSVEDMCRSAWLFASKRAT